MKNLVLLSYGRETEYKRAIMAVLSFWAWYSGEKSDIRTIVFTDNPDYFKPFLPDLEVEYGLLTPEKLEAMLDGKAFIHRIKIAIIDEVFQRYPAEDLFFIDSDTFFVADAQPWLQSFAPGKSFMHLLEYSFEEAVNIYSGFNQKQYPKAFIKLIESKTFRVNQAEEQFNKYQFSWNSGVLGLNKEIATYMPDVYNLSAEFFEATGWIISEQLAFALILQTRTKVLPTEQYVHHYWGQRQKLFIDNILNAKLTDDFAHLGLRQKLVHVKKLTRQWPRLIKLDKIQERAINNFTDNNVLAGCKYALYAFAQSPFDFRFMKELYSLRGKNRKQLTSSN